MRKFKVIYQTKKDTRLHCLENIIRKWELMKFQLQYTNKPTRELGLREIYHGDSGRVGRVV